MKEPLPKNAIRAALDAWDGADFDPNEPLLTTRQLAKKLRLTGPQSVHDLRRRHPFPFVKLSRFAYRYRWSEVMAYFEAQREKIGDPDEAQVFVVEPLKIVARPHLKFRVRGTGTHKDEKPSYCKTEAEAREHAAKRNAAVGRKAVAPLPRRTRQMKPDDPFYQVRPYNCESAQSKFEVIAYFEGESKKPQTWHFRTDRDALHFANKKNLEAARLFALRDEQTNPTPPGIPDPRAKAPPSAEPPPPLWTATQMEGVDSLHAPDPMKGPPFRIFATNQAHYHFVVRGPKQAADGKEFRKFFVTEREAKTLAHMRNTEAQNQGLESLSFPLVAAHDGAALPAAAPRARQVDRRCHELLSRASGAHQSELPAG